MWSGGFCFVLFRFVLISLVNFVKLVQFSVKIRGENFEFAPAQCDFLITR